MTNKSMIRVYYNSACPVCNAGIESQKGRLSRCEIQWHDIHKNNRAVSELKSDVEFVRERLHVIDECGQVQIGFDAFLTIWRNSPDESWKFRLFGLPLVKQLCQVIYNLFAFALYQWNKLKKRW
jgi:predicted DCC family thiol-disulfide oxidoreductase YuxK